VTDPATEVATQVDEIDFLVERERFAQAEERLRHALARSPDHPRLLYLAAYVQFRTGRLPDARATLDTLLARHPTDYAGRILLFEVLDDLEQFPAAEAVILEVLRDEPEDAASYARYARLMLRTLHLEKARSLSAEALRRDPDDGIALSVATLTDLVLHGGRHDLPTLQALLERQPDAESTARILIATLVHRHRHRDALAVAQALLASRPRDAALVNLLVELRSLTHWSMRPVMTLARFGWAGSAGVWLGMIVLVSIGRRTQSSWVGAASMLYLAFCVYTWIWPSLFKRIVAR